MEFLLGFITGVFALSWYWVLLELGVILIFTICVFNEVVFGSALFLLIGIGFPFIFNIWDVQNIDLLLTFKIILVYLIIGCVWSFFMYRLKVKSLVERKLKTISSTKNKTTPTPTKEYFMEYVEDHIDKETILYWILYFPISMIKFCLSDLIYYIIDKCGKVYKYLAMSVINSLVK